MDFNTEYDTTKVDTPENRRGMTRLMERYMERVFKEDKVIIPDAGKINSTSISGYLRVLADYSDPGLGKPANMDKAMNLARQDKQSVTYTMAVFNRMRYMDFFYVSEDGYRRAWPVFTKISISGVVHDALAIFTRRKLAENMAGRLYTHQTSIYGLIAAAEEKNVNYILINPLNSSTYFGTGNIRESVERFSDMDKFWHKIKYGGVKGEDLFPLLAQDFLGREVSCVSQNGKIIQGYCNPCTEGTASGYNIETAGGKTEYVPLSGLKLIHELPYEDK